MNKKNNLELYECEICKDLKIKEEIWKCNNCNKYFCYVCRGTSELGHLAYCVKK